MGLRRVSAFSQDYAYAICHLLLIFIAKTVLIFTA